MALSRRSFLGSLAGVGTASLFGALGEPRLISSPLAVGTVPADAATSTTLEAGLRLGVPASPLTLDPSLATDVESHRVMRQIYDNLVDVDLDTGDPIPGLATGWEASTDQREVTFQLRPDVVFHDGTDLTAEAVVANVQRWATTPERVGTSTLQHRLPLSFATVFGGFRGDPGCLFDEAVADDELTVRLVFSEPVFGVVRALTDPAFAITSPESWDAADAAAGQTGSLVALAGTGAYRLADDEDLPAGTMRLIRDPAATGSHVADADDTEVREASESAPEVVELVAVSAAQERLIGLRTHQLDLFDTVDPGSLRALVQSGAQVLQRDPLSVLYLGFNLRHPVLTSLRVRRAVALAVNRSLLVEQTMLTGSSAAHHFIPPALAAVPEDLPRYDYSVAEAARELAASGYDGEDLAFTYPVDASRPYLADPQRVFARVSADLAGIGLRIVPDPVPWDDGYLEHVSRAGGSSSSSRAFHLLGRNCTYRDPLHVLTSIFGAASGEFGYTNPTVDNRLARARSATDAAARQGLIDAVTRSIATDLPALPLAFPISALATGPRVGYYPISPVLDEHLVRIRLSS
ncbi:MAG: ABC transporter substrate-binding protein [Micrococcaceae bacterium]